MKIFNLLKKSLLDFDKLDDGGERVDLIINDDTDAQGLDIYQQSHLSRYRFAVDFIPSSCVIGDFACGTGYGTVMLAKNASRVVGADMDERVIESIRKRYKTNKNVEFQVANLLDLKDKNEFDIIVSFETMEHFFETDILRLLSIYHGALRSNGMLIFSTPYMQEASTEALNLGFHKTFLINEGKINTWLRQSNFKVDFFQYQDYLTHTVKNHLQKPDFIICVARRK